LGLILRALPIKYGLVVAAAGDRPLAFAAFRIANAVPFGSPILKTPFAGNGELTGAIWSAKALPMEIRDSTRARVT